MHKERKDKQVDNKTRAENKKRERSGEKTLAGSNPDEVARSGFLCPSRLGHKVVDSERRQHIRLPD